MTKPNAIPFVFGKYALVMELKKAETEEELEETAREALNQIREKGYGARYEKLGFSSILIGMAFHGKRVVIECADNEGDSPI